MFSRRAAIPDFVHGGALTVAGRNRADEVSLSQTLDLPLAPGNFIGIRSDRDRFVTASCVRVCSGISEGRQQCGKGHG